MAIGVMGNYGKKRQTRNYLRIAYLAVAVLLFVALEGCYYMQAIGGQMDVLQKRRPLDEVIGDEETTDELRARLKMVQKARQFSIDELQLPDNGSYTSYADLHRDYVVWNVFAAPEFSLTPKQWCFPVAGCVTYRGYFKQEKATKFAASLKEDGYDITVGGVAAYSTLGRFDDPILNTMMRWPDLGLVETLFHELAHQKLYVKNDSAFNESFATAVGDIGLRRWVEAEGKQDELERVDGSEALQKRMQGLVTGVQDELWDLYESERSDAEKRVEKAQTLGALSAAAQSEIDASGLNVANWLAAPLNNARIVSLGVYEGSNAAFKQIFEDCQNDLDCFYAECQVLADLDYVERQARLTALNEKAELNLLAQPAAAQPQ